MITLVPSLLPESYSPSANEDEEHVGPGVLSLANAQAKVPEAFGNGRRVVGLGSATFAADGRRR